MEPKTFGEYLRTERELRTVSMDDVARVTRIHMKYLKALEENDFNSLPASTFIKGFIRSYAKAIGLDEESVILTFEYYQKQQKSADSSQSTEKKATLNGSRKLIIILVILILLLIFIMILAYYFSNSGTLESSENLIFHDRLHHFFDIIVKVI